MPAKPANAPDQKAAPAAPRPGIPLAPLSSAIAVFLSWRLWADGSSRDGMRAASGRRTSRPDRRPSTDTVRTALQRRTGSANRLRRTRPLRSELAISMTSPPRSRAPKPAFRTATKASVSPARTAFKPPRSSPRSTRITPLSSIPFIFCSTRRTTARIPTPSRRWPDASWLGKAPMERGFKRSPPSTI